MIKKRTFFFKGVIIFLLSIISQLTHGATYIVDSNGDGDDLAVYTAADGTNTLRKCIRLANANVGADIINFNITGSTLITNSVGGGGAWFSITSPLTINGYSQTGAAAGAPVIELDGNSSGRWFAIELLNGSAGSTINGLIIYGTNIGVRLESNTSGNTIAGCWIGVDNTGNAAAANAITEHGIRSESSDNNVIGGNGGVIDRNVISSCGQVGVRFEGISTNNKINGNYIGVGIDGTTDLGNGQMGVRLENCSSCSVGDGGANEGNVISGNGQEGIWGHNSDDFTIKGNIIGLASDGNTIVDNDFSGIRMQGGSDIGQIGGAGTDERNLISGNTDNGVTLDDCNDIVIQGNYIGVATNGSISRPNTGVGVIAINCEVLTIGGSNAGEGNVVSSNGNHGISAWGGDARNTRIQGNMIGVSADGTTALGNSFYGIELNENEDSQIGGTAINARNIISNNGWSGIRITSSPRTVVENNYVGVDVTGLVDMGNVQQGIDVFNSADVVIGGTTSASRNIISGNTIDGVRLSGTSTGAQIKANFIGIGSDGVTAVKNDENGIKSFGSADGMTVGGPTASEGNVISANGQWTVDTDPDNGIVGDGIRVLGTDNHLIQNNYIGTDVTGTIGVGNHWGGISLNDESDNNDVFDNLIADNRNEGIWLYNSDGNEIYRNVIGVGTDGGNLGNWDYGIVMQVTSQSNTIGGSAANANTIAYTRGERPGLDGVGVTVSVTASNFNEITFNSIYCNAGEGILRQGTANENVAAPMISASNANDINGTGTNGMTIHVYRNNTAGPGCNCEGEIYVGSTIVAGGTWSLTHSLGLSASAATSVSATQTTTNNSTSEFSMCSSPLPVTFMRYEAYRDAELVNINWSTISEINNSHFIIQISTDGVLFKNTAVIEGSGNSSSIMNYSYQIENSASETIYLKIVQVDFDGTVSNGRILAVDPINKENNVSINHDHLNIYSQEENLTVRLITLDGKELWYKIVSSGESFILVSDLPSSVYIVKLEGKKSVFYRKFYINCY